MSTAVVSTSAAQGRRFVFDDEAESEVRAPAQGQEHAEEQEFDIVRSFQAATSNRQSTTDSVGSRKPAIGNHVIPASRLEIRPAPEMVSSGVPAIDALTGGLPRGCLTEICGPASSGRTTVLLAALAAATRRGEFCVVVDASDALDPQSAAAVGIELERLLWVRCGEAEKISPRRHRDAERNFCKENSEARLGSRSAQQSEHRLEQVLRATDLLLESGGFGLIVLDLADLPLPAARRIPLTTWFRFRRAVEHTPTILLAIEPQPIAGSCSSLLLQLGVPSTQYPVPSSNETFVDKVTDAATKDRNPTHAQLLAKLQIRAELTRSRLERKPAQSVIFETKTAWAG